MYIGYNITKMETNNLERSYAIKFRDKLGEGVTNTYEKIKKVFGNDSLSRAQVFRWHKVFVIGREKVEDERQSGRPTSARASKNVDRVRAFIHQDQRLMIRMSAG
jgi:hypothetical protein